VLISLVEQVAAFLLDRVESIFSSLDALASLVKLGVNLLESGLRVAESDKPTIRASSANALGSR
jgi:hypothetical protein